MARRARPRFTLKAAISLDGAVATATGESRWITGAAARRDGHRLRARRDAILVGIGTVLADDPRLSCRVRGGRDPIRVVVDGRLRTPLDAALLGDSPRTIVATTVAAPAARERRLAARGAEVWRLGRGEVDLGALAGRLAAAGVRSVLVEGGPTLHRGFLAAGLADELVLYLAPRALPGGLSWLGGPPIGRLSDGFGFRLTGPPVRLGRDLKLVLRWAA